MDEKKDGNIGRGGKSVKSKEIKIMVAFVDRGNTGGCLVSRISTKNF